MSTWKSKLKNKYKTDTGFGWVNCELTWEYQTTADILRITTKISEHTNYGKIIPEKETTELYNPEDAIALLQLLIDWAETYEGKGTVTALLEKRNLQIKDKTGDYTID